MEVVISVETFKYSIATECAVGCESDASFSKLHVSISEYAGFVASTRFFKSANQVQTHLTVMRGPYGPPGSTHKRGALNFLFHPAFSLQDSASHL